MVWLKYSILFLLRKSSTKSVSSWSESMSWDTTPTRLATTPRSSRCHQEAPAAVRDGPAPNGSGTCPLTGRAGHGEALKPEAPTKPRCSCLECWATRTMRWCGGSGRARAHITPAVEENAGDGGTGPGGAKSRGQRTKHS